MGIEDQLRRRDTSGLAIVRGVVGPGPQVALLLGAGKDCVRQVVELLHVLHVAAFLHHPRLELVVLVKALGNGRVVELGGPLTAVLRVKDGGCLGAHLPPLLGTLAHVAEIRGQQSFNRLVGRMEFPPKLTPQEKPILAADPACDLEWRAGHSLTRLTSIPKSFTLSCRYSSDSTDSSSGRDAPPQGDLGTRSPRGQRTSPAATQSAPSRLGSYKGLTPLSCPVKPTCTCETLPTASAGAALLAVPPASMAGTLAAHARASERTTVAASGAQLPPTSTPKTTKIPGGAGVPCWARFVLSAL